MKGFRDMLISDPQRGKEGKGVAGRGELFTLLGPSLRVLCSLEYYFAHRVLES